LDNKKNLNFYKKKYLFEKQNERAESPKNNFRIGKYNLGGQEGVKRSESPTNESVYPKMLAISSPYTIEDFELREVLGMKHLMILNLLFKKQGKYSQIFVF
jgi:hypothetical protein